MGAERIHVEYLHDAVRRLGKPGVRVIPQALALAIVPVGAPSLRARWTARYVTGWDDVHGFDPGRLGAVVLADGARPYVPLRAEEAVLLGGPAPLAHFDLGVSSLSRFMRDVAVRCTGPGLRHGWLGLFSATLPRMWCCQPGRASRPSTGATSCFRCCRRSQWNRATSWPRGWRSRDMAAGASRSGQYAV